MTVEVIYDINCEVTLTDPIREKVIDKPQVRYHHWDTIYERLTFHGGIKDTIYFARSKPGKRCSL